MCVVTKKEVLWDYPWFHSSYWRAVSIDLEEKESLHFLWGLFQCLLYSRHVRFTQQEKTNNHKVVAEHWLSQKKRILSRTRFHRKSIVQSFNNTDDWLWGRSHQLPKISKTIPAESMVGSYPAESTDQWTAASGITTKIPPLFDRSTSCLKYEELIDFWQDLTVLEAVKRGPALKNRLVGDAAMYKGHLDRENLRAEDGVKYFKDTLRRHFIKGAQSVFLWRFYQFFRARRGDIDMVKMDRQVLTSLEASARCLDGPFTHATSEEVTTHGRIFPLSDNLTTLMFLLQVISVKPR